MYWRIAAIISVIVAGAVKIHTTPDTIAYAIDLPAQKGKTVSMIASYESTESEPNFLSLPASITPQDRDCLARNIYFEAKNQSISGQMAVGVVTLKRVESNKFPDDICGVVKFTHHKYASGFPVKHKCHFSWYCDGKTDKPADRRAWTVAQNVADALLSKESGITDMTNGADHYHADYIDPPRWTQNMVKVAQIDNHIFYTTAL